MSKRRSSLTIGQLAARWSVSPERIRQLIDAGFVSGAFRIPSSGRFGETIKIPLSVIEATETEWQIIPQVSGKKGRPRRSTGGASLRHFPELTDLSQDKADT